MKAGRLTQRITFQRRSDKVNALGEQKEKWSDIVAAWALVEPLTGREFFAAQQVQSDVSVRIVCRASKQLSTITSKDRIQHHELYYDIRSVIDVNSRGKELQFMCTQHIGL